MHATNFKAWMLAGAALALVGSLPAIAGRYAAQAYDLPAQDLGDALRAVARRSGQTIIAPTELVAGKRAPALRGDFSPEAAVAHLLAGSGLNARRVGTALVIQRSAAESAQDAPGRGEGVGDQNIVVTGTRIRGRAPAGAAVLTLDRNAILESGYATTQQIVQAMPQNFGGGSNEATVATNRNGAEANAAYGASVNLRGLGASSTLVLLDGERPPMAGLNGVFADLSMIPTSMIERIEILADGASALYGSDAVAGVVNIVPRKAFRGLELSVRGGLADGFDEQQAGGIAGIGGADAHLTLSYEYYRRSALGVADRPYVSEDLRRYGLGDYRAGPGLPATLLAGTQSFIIPAGQDGTALTAAQLQPGVGAASDSWAGADVLPKQERHAVYAAGWVTPADGLELYAQGLFGHRSFTRRDRTSLGAPTATVPVTNPFYVDPLGTAQPVGIRYDFRKELGVEGVTGSAEGLGATGGLRWSPGRWQIDAHLTFGRQAERWTYDNIVNRARMAAALADPNRATALNLFGDGTANNPATIAALRGSSSGAGRYTLLAQQVRADGPLFALAAGDLRLALGAEHRREHYRNLGGISDYLTLTPTVEAGIVNARRDVTAGYAELSLPLSAPGGAGLGIGRLDLSAAVRGEHYSDFGDTVNPKFGVSWMPLAAVRLRGSFGTSFRAPAFNNLRQDALSKGYFAYPLTDPASQTGITNALIISGNDPDIGPERATSWTAGIDLRPDQPEGLRAQLTYFSIDYRDRIANPAAALVTFFTNRAVYAPIIDTQPDPAVVAAYFASPYYQTYNSITPAQVSAIVYAQTQNLAQQRQRGLDFDFGYRAALAGGHAELGAGGAYLFEYTQRLTPTAPVTRLLDTIGNLPDLRLRSRLLYDGDAFGAALFVNYVDGYTNNSKIIARPVSAWTTIDFQLRYRLGDFRLSLSATNLLDAAPPRTAYGLTSTTIGYDPENANALGRVVALALTRSW
jgi:iron complex outermembrane recepter protein